MACGSWELNLDPASPRSIVENITPFSTLCITPGRCDGLTRDEVIAQSRYTGIVRRRSNELCTLSGPSAMAWLGDEDGKGMFPSSFSIDGTTSGQDMISDLFALSSGLYVNYLTLGSYSSLPATPVWAKPSDYYLYDRETSRQFLDRVCRFLDWQYRVNPDFSVDVELRGSLFATTPSVVVIAEHLGEPISDVIRTVVAGEVGATISHDDWATTVLVADGTYYGDDDQSTIVYSGATPGNWAGLRKNIQGEDLGSNGDAAAQATVELGTNYGAHRLVDVSIRLDDPRARLEPGDAIYVYDPLNELYDLDNQLDVMGQCIFPVSLEVSEMTWQPTEGMGAWIILNGTETVWDISEHVLWGTGPTALKVGQRRPTLREVVNGRN